MLSQIISTYEHCTIDSLSEEVLVELLKQQPKLIDLINLKDKSFKTGYFIGLDWLVNTGEALYVKPKLDKNSNPTHYLKILGLCLNHPEILVHTEQLFEIEFDKKPIKINKTDDHITPLIIVQFLRLVQTIVKKGLRRTYYKTESNIRNSIKGKILVSKTIKQNQLKNKLLHTYCTYDEFGINSPENRLIKKGLQFVLKYTKLIHNDNINFSPVLNFILPAFEKVDDNIEPHHLGNINFNPFYKDYTEAIRLAKLILKRFGYNINAINKNEEIEVPPFWIDMSKLFELYVLSKLKESLGAKEIIFQSNAKYGFLDFLRTTEGNEMIIDAKYKLDYKKGEYNIDDIRQLSAYARDKGVLEKLSIEKTKWQQTVLNCIIIYPDDNAQQKIVKAELLSFPITQFEKFYKLGIGIPTIP